MKNTYKLKIDENKTIEIRPSDLPGNITLGLYRKLLEIEANAEKKYEHLKNTSQYKLLVAIEANIETALLLLQKIDKSITREHIENWDELGNFIMDFYNIETSEEDKKK